MINKPDIYEISKTMFSIAKKNSPEIDDKTLMVNIFGYLIDSNAHILNQSAMTASFNMEEALPILAKQEKTIMTNSVTYNIQDINAKPAKMEILFSLLISDLDVLFKTLSEKDLLKSTSRREASTAAPEEFLERESVILYKDIPFTINKLEYHFDYNIILSKTINAKGEAVYSAIYDIDKENQASDITNPYLKPPYKYSFNGDDFLGIYCNISQYNIELIEKPIITDNIVLNKTVDFEFDGELSYFNVVSTNPDTGARTFLKPIVEGMPYIKGEKYCFYNYINRNHIRIKFVIDSYYPPTGSVIQIYIATTEGAKANFKYRDNTYLITSLESESHDYNMTNAMITPISESMNGRNAKTLSEIKDMIPKEILSRRVITCERDLYNFFNKSIDNTIVKFYKRTHNQIDHLYYTYLIVKDKFNNIIPTNTTTVLIDNDGMKCVKVIDGRYIIPAGSMFKLIDSQTAKLIPKENLTLDEIKELELKEFIYSSTYNIVINPNPLSSKYYMDVIKRDTSIYNSYINKNSPVHMITNFMSVSKIFFRDNNYHFTVKYQQNIDSDMKIIEYDENDNEKIKNTNIKSFLNIYYNKFNYYVEGTLKHYDRAKYTFTYEYTLHCDSFIDKENRLRIKDIFNGGTRDKIYVDLAKDIDISFMTYLKLEEEYGRFTGDNIIPADYMKGWTMANIYEPENKFSLYTNLSEIIKSTVKLNTKTNINDGFTLNKVPLVKYSYIMEEDSLVEFVDDIMYKKLSMDDIIANIIQPFGIDFKFFNTYGKSNIYTIGHEDRNLDKVNIDLEFNLKLNPETKETIVNEIVDEIKNYIENLNEIDSSIHMTNLTTSLNNKFGSDIEWIEFVKLNSYNKLTDFQLLKRNPNVEELNITPEFLSIDLDKNSLPKIIINIK